MNDLIEQLMAKAGISADQAVKSLHTVKEYIVTKFPMLEGAVENMFAGLSTQLQEVKTDPTVPVVAVPVVAVEEPSVLDKISDVIPGQAGEKIEEFAKGAAHKASEAFDTVKEKLGGMFGHDDKK